MFDRLKSESFVGLNSEMDNQDTTYALYNIETKLRNLSSKNNHHYPGCDNKCLDRRNRTKIGANYIFQDGRCFKATVPCDKYDCLDKIRNNQWPDNPRDHVMFESCDNSFDTREHGIVARYIRVERGTSDNSVAIAFMEAYDIFGNYLEPVTGRTFPEHPPYYGTNLLEYDLSKYAMTTNIDGAYIQLDLGRDCNIFAAVIVNAASHRTNILGNNIIFIKSNKLVTFQKAITIVQDIYIIEPKFNAEPFAEPFVEPFVEQPTKKDTYSGIKNYYYPTCIKDGCLEKNGATIMDYEYKFSPVISNDLNALIEPDDRCFKTIEPCIGCLDKIQGNEFSYPSIAKYFASCTPDVDSMIQVQNGKFVVIDTINLLTITEIETYYFDKPVKINFIMTNPINVINPSVNMIDNNPNTFSSVPPSGYVQSSYVDNMHVTDIYISVPTALKRSIINATISFLNNNKIILHYYVFTEDFVSSQKDETKWPGITTFHITIDGTGGPLLKTIKVMPNSFIYPECITEGCLNNGRAIPNAMYNLHDGRCIKPVTNCMGCIDNTDITQLDINTVSCLSNDDTRVFACIGRYIRIERLEDYTGFNLAEIDIYNYINDYNIVKSTSYPVNSIDGTMMVAAYSYDKNANTYASVNNSITHSNEPFMQFDLGYDKKITDINLVGIDTSLINTIVYIINNDNKPVFGYNITSLNSNNSINIKTIKLTDAELGILPSVNLITVYSYPDCIPSGCLQNGLPISNQQYEVPSTNTCYIVKKSAPECMPFSNIDTMDLCYTSCSNLDDTRYAMAYGRFVRINNISSTFITIDSIDILDNNNVPYTISYAYANNVTSIQYRADNLITRNGSTSVAGVGSYIQLDLGSDKNIYSINYSGSITLVNCFITIIKLDPILNNGSGNVVSKTILTTASGTIKPKINMNTAINITESFQYPSCNSSNFKDCLNASNIPRPFFKYNFDNGICVLSKNNPGPANCLESIGQGTMTDITTYFDSCDPNIDTRYKLLVGRYIRIQSNTGTPFKIASLTGLYENNAIPVSNISGYPIDKNFSINNIIDSNNNTYTSVLAKTNETIPYVELDLGSNQIINSVSIKKYIDDLSLVGTTLYIISADGSTVFQKSLTAADSIVNVYEIPGTTNNINTTNTYNYPSCVDYGCTTNNHQNINQQYMIGNKCFKAVNNNSVPSCLDVTNSLYGSAMDSCFASCSTSTDTRYGPVSGRYIRLSKNNSESDMRILELRAIDINGSSIPIYSTYANGTTNKLYRSDNLLPNGTSEIGPVIVTGTESYIQTDLEINKTIKSISITVPTGYTFAHLLNNIIRVLDDNGAILYEYIIKSNISNNTLYDVIKNKDGSIILPLIEEYSYPSCTSDTNFECISSTNLSKPKFKYNLSQGKCVIAKKKCTVSNCMTQLDSGTLTLSQMNDNFDMCTGGIDNRFPSVSGRYIRIQKLPNDDTGFKLSGLEAWNEQYITPTDTRAFPLIETNYSKYLMDQLTSTLTIVGPTKNDANGTAIKPFVQLDLGSDKLIKRVLLSPILGDNSLKNTILYVISSTGAIVYQQILSIIDTSKSFNAYPISIPGAVYDNINIVNTFAYPTCSSPDTGCITDGTKQIDKQKYITSDGRCLQAKGYQSTSSCLNNISQLYGFSMDACFDSCSPTTETRYSSLTSRFIRLVSNGTTLKLKQMNAYETLQNPHQVISKHCNPYMTYMYRSDNLNTTNVAASTGYIQIDIGSDKTIAYVKILAAESIAGSELQIISNNFMKRYSAIITDTGLTELIIAVNLNITEVPVTVIEQFDYISDFTSETTFNGSVTEDHKPKPLYIYRFPNIDSTPTLKVSVQCITNTPSEGILNDIANNNLTYDDMNLSFASTSTDIDTRFPHANGRYIRVERNTGLTSGFNLTNISLLNATSQPIESLVWPMTGNGFSTGPIISATTDMPPVPYVQLDYGSNVIFTKITLVTSDLSLNNCTIYILNIDGSVVTQVPIIDIANIKTYELLYIKKMLYNPHTMTYTFPYPSCGPTGCVTSDSHFSNQMYQVSDGRCFKTKNKRLLTDCLNNINTLTPTAMSSCFDSCNVSYDSRYPTAVGRFIRLTRIKTSVSGSNNIQLAFMGALDATGTLITSVMGHAQPVDGTKFGDYLIDTDTTTVAGAIGLNSYLQIDLGSNIMINKIRLICSGTDSSILDGTKIQIIRENMTIIYEKVLQASDINISNTSNDIPVVFNQPGTNILNISESFNWPCASSDCINKTGRTKPFFKYDSIPGNRCVTARKMCTTDNCIDDLIKYNMSDSMILNQFDSCVSTYKSQFTTIIGQYIRIRRVSPSNLPINIRSIKVFDKYGTQISTPNTKTYVKPLVEPSYGKYMVDADDTIPTFTITGTSISDSTENYGYVQIDLGSDTEISNIEIKSGDPNSLVSTELIVANSLMNIIYRKSFSSTIADTVVYL